MTTGSSSPRSPEYAISAVDLPTGETTTATGTHPVRPPGAQAEAEASIVPPFAARSPARQEPSRQEPGRQESDREEPGRQEPDREEPAFREPPPQAPARQEAAPVPQDPFLQEPFGVQEPFGQEPVAPDAVVREYGDPVGDLVRAAVADRPLEEIVDLITMLERSPQHAQATVDALRAVGVNRSVEDVTRLVGLLTRPPRHSNSADEAIRAAAECRSVEDVTRLMELLHRTPLQPHCGQEAVRAAATGRPVEELVQLIGRLAEDGLARPDSPDARRLRAALDGAGEDDAPEPAPRPAGLAGVFAAADRRGREGDRRGRERRRTPRPSRRTPRRERGRDEDGAPRDHAPHDDDHDHAHERTARRTARGAAWPVWLTVAVLAGCGVAYFPLHQNDASVRAYGAALGLSALCLVLALLLTVRPAVPLLAAAVVGPAALASAKLYGSATPSARVSEAVDLTLAPTWVAVAVAVLTSLVALTALCARVASQAPAGRRPARPVAGTSGATD
ncbi:hypothetical protein [Streptomyces sp. NPDC017230]|uniref:hypothetical protein n=1 Tax=unclassified Streptomyces TaxID=2593676 RepID=UPI00379C4C8A